VCLVDGTVCNVFSVVCSRGVQGVRVPTACYVRFVSQVVQVCGCGVVHVLLVDLAAWGTHGCTACCQLAGAWCASVQLVAVHGIVPTVWLAWLYGVRWHGRVAPADMVVVESSGLHACMPACPVRARLKWRCMLDECRHTVAGELQQERQQRQGRGVVRASNRLGRQRG
jgi:hypothetical protein